MSEPFRYPRRVEFRDTDMAGIVHFSVFFAYMEEAEHAFLKSIGLDVFSDIGDDHISWPRVAAECNYRNAVRFEDQLSVAVSIDRIGKSSVAYRHEIYCDQKLVADGKVTTVCCKMEHGQRPESIPIPTEFVSLLQPYVNAE